MEDFRALKQTVMVIFWTLWSIGSLNAGSIDLPRLGQVTLIEPASPPKGLVILLSDPAEKKPESPDALAEAGQVVAVVDSARFVSNLENSDNPCIRASDDLVALKHVVFKRYRLADPASALLAGSGAAGALAYAVLAQSNPNEFSGAAAFRLNPDFPSTKPLCSGAPYRKTALGFRYLPVDRLNGYWRIMTASPDDPNIIPYARHQKDVILRLRDYDDIDSAILSVLSDQAKTEPGGGQDIGALPLVLLPAVRPSRTMAVIYSGDGGWRDLDRQIGEELKKNGISVVGVDTLRYFWHYRAPEDAATDLARLVGYFSKLWDTPDVLLIGYSFGADVIPFMVNRIPSSVLGQIRLISLLALSKSADFEIRVTGWLNGPASTNARPLTPELKQITNDKIQCFVGTEELSESGCTDNALSRTEIIRMPGGHHFDGDYVRLAQTILKGAGRRGADLTRRDGFLP